VPEQGCTTVANGQPRSLAQVSDLGQRRRARSPIVLPELAVDLRLVRPLVGAGPCHRVEQGDERSLTVADQSKDSQVAGRPRSSGRDGKRSDQRGRAPIYVPRACLVACERISPSCGVVSKLLHPAGDSPARTVASTSRTASCTPGRLAPTLARSTGRPPSLLHWTAS
jgi:hypothetical protein